MTVADRWAGPRRNALALTASALAHGLILVSLFTGLSAQTRLREGAGVVVDISVPFDLASRGQPTPAQIVPPQPAQPKTAPPPPVPLAPPATPDSADVAPVPSLPTAATLPPVDPTLEPAALTPTAPGTATGTAQSMTSAGPACDLTGPVQQALQADAQARLALARIPRQARSVANAIMLWDAGWPADASLGGAAIAAPIRQRIVQVVSAAPATCADQWVLGPRFVTVSDATGTTVIALGSGSWKWSDLLKASPAKSPSDS